MNPRSLLFLSSLLIIFLAGTALTTAQDATPEATEEPDAPLGQVELLVPEVVEVLPHDRAAYTEGLAFSQGEFYESTGQYGASSVRRVDPASGKVLKEIKYSDEFSAAGLAIVDDRVIQLTWREGRAHFFEKESLLLLGLYFYNVEGVGLCYDGAVLWMSAGNPNLLKRDPVSFRVTEILPVTLDRQGVNNLGELECVGDMIYAVLLPTNTIARIDKASGRVTGLIDASHLLTEEEQANLIPDREVLNGIAYDPEKDLFYLTGRRWDKVFVVRFVPEAETDKSE